jgi:Lon protease-like protein
VLARRELPLFPLRSVLCPGVALPLHIFEERYRLMIGRCLERREPFGVLFVREGREVGPLTGRIAEVGTTAAIRRAGRYPDGRLDILTVGEQRFHLDEVIASPDPYLVGRVTLLEETVGPRLATRARADRVGRRFLRYLELLQPAVADDGPEIEIEVEIELDTPSPTGDAATATEPSERAGSSEEAGARDGAVPVDGAEPLAAEMDPADLTPEQRHDLLMTAARRLTATDDPTALSYVLTALVQVDLAERQQLLEAPDTFSRLQRLEALLKRESWHLERSLRPIIIDPARPPYRDN